MKGVLTRILSPLVHDGTCCAGKKRIVSDFKDRERDNIWRGRGWAVDANVGHTCVGTVRRWAQ